MTSQRSTAMTPRVAAALRELNAMISQRFPEATFVVEEGFDPKGISLVMTVDIADTDDVIAAIEDRPVALQVDEGLPIYVTPLRPIERVMAHLHERAAAAVPSSLPLT